LFEESFYRINYKMAAILAGMRTGLRAIGFTIASSDEIVDEQGYDSLTALAELTDQTCADLVALIRRPGGTIPNPTAGAGGTVLPPIPNPGIKVGHRALTNLKLAAFAACHMIRTSRPLGSPVTALTTANLAGLAGLKEAEDAYSDPPAIPTLDKIDRIRNHIEDIDAQLLKTLGMAKAPLAYVVRDLVNVPPHANDPSTGYTTVQEEMVARMPHTHNSYREDNIAVWDIIRDSIHDSEAFSWVKRCERRRNGRAAYLALTAHYLGDAKNEALRNAADNRILNTFYGGEKNRFNWTRYVSVHKECHNDLEVTGTAMPEDDKVRRLLMGIQTATLQTAVLFVRSSPALRNDFDAAVDSITTVVETIKDTSKRPFSQISSAETEDTDGQSQHDASRGGRGYQGGRGRGYQGRGGRDGRGRGYQGRGGRGRGYQGRSSNMEPWTEPISTRWYQGHELARMSEDQRQQMRNLREGHESQRQIGSAETGQYGSTPGQYYQQPPYHLPPYPPANLPPMGPPPPPPPPPPPAHHVGAVHQQNNHYGNSNIHHPALNRFTGNQQGFAPPGPPRF
jgi:hypothetical protein